MEYGILQNINLNHKIKNYGEKNKITLTLIYEWTTKIPSIDNEKNLNPSTTTTSCCVVSCRTHHDAAS